MSTMKKAAGELRIPTAASTQDPVIVAQTGGKHSADEGKAVPMFETGKSQAPRFSMRQQRVLDALRSTRGRLSRELVDQLAGASNGPSVIASLRGKLGRDAIETTIVEVVDRDGRTARPGRYKLTDEGRARLAQWGSGRRE